MEPEKQINESWIPSHLQITVAQGRDLALKSKNVNSEVYVTVQLDKERDSTPLLIRHTHPIWNHTFEIPLMSLQSVLEVQVRQKSKFSDEHIGQIRVPLSSLPLSKKLRKNWYKLAARPGKTSSKIRGDILLTTCFLSQWDSKDSANHSIDIEPCEQSNNHKMLRRTKSEYKNKTKNSPKPDQKSKQKSVFDRLRKNKTDAFEECEDFVVSVRTPESPPTPSSNEKQSHLFSSMSVDVTYTPTSSPPNSSSDFREMFSEATHLERSGVMDLSLVDSTTRLEMGRHMFESTMNCEDGERGGEDIDVSPITRTYSFRHKRPLRSQSLSIKTNPTSLDSPDPLRHSNVPSTPPNPLTSPRFSPAVTYKATSMKKRVKRLNNGNQQNSTQSVDNDSTTSEYYSSSSFSENPTKSFSALSIDKEGDKKTANEEGSLKNTPLSNGIVPHGSPIVQVSEIDGHSPLVMYTPTTPGSSLAPPKELTRRERSVPTETLTLERGQVVMRNKTRKRYASDTMDHKRHSADIESLLRLTALGQGKHDGLGNVLNAQQLKMKLKRQSTTEKGQESLSQPVTDHMTVTRSANTTPPCVQMPDNGCVSVPPTPSHDSIGLVSPLNSLSPPLGASDSLPVLKRTFHMDDKSDLVAPAKLPSPFISTDKAAFFESEGSSSTTSMLYPPSSICTSLDSSYSSDYTSFSYNNKRLDDDNLSSSQCATPSSATPTATREGTPSPELHPLVNNVMTTNSSKQEEVNKRARHTYNKSNFDVTRDKIPPPLPPSLNYSSSTLPSRGKFASTSDVNELVSAAMRVLAPHQTTPTNVRHAPYHTYSISANNSGRTSPVIEEDEDDIKHTSPVKTTPTMTTVITPDNDSNTEDTPTVKSSAPNHASNSVKNTVPQSKGYRRLPTNYESSSLQRRKQATATSSGSGSGLKKAISLYQDNKRQHQQLPGARRALFRGVSLDAAPTVTKGTTSIKKDDKANKSTTVKPATTTQHSPLSKTTSHRGKQTEDSTSSSTVESTRNKEPVNSTSHQTNATPVKSDSQTNGVINNQTTPTTGGHFDLPPPPDVCHTSVAEQVCGMNQSLENSREESWKDSQSTVATSSDEWEELQENDLHLLSKQSLINLVLEKNDKLMKSKAKLKDTQTYLDSLLLKVIDKCPELLSA